MKIETDIIIRAKDGREVTEACVNSIINNTSPDTAYRILLVQSGRDVYDFNPRDGDVLFYAPGAIGAITATNIGMSIALQGEGKYVIIMDNDTRVPDGDVDWLNRFIYELEEEDDTACVGATSGMVNPPQHILSVTPTYTSDWHNDKTQSAGIKKNPPAVWFVSFCVLFRKSVLQQLGPWDVRFDPGNWEDTDYSVVVRKSGYNIRVARSVYIHHDAHQTFGDDLPELLRENQYKFFQKWGPGALWDLGMISTKEILTMLEKQEVAQ